MQNAWNYGCFLLLTVFITKIISESQENKNSSQIELLLRNNSNVLPIGLKANNETNRTSSNKPFLSETITYPNNFSTSLPSLTTAYSVNHNDLKKNSSDLIPDNISRHYNSSQLNRTSVQKNASEMVSVVTEYYSFNSNLQSPITQETNKILNESSPAVSINFNKTDFSQRGGILDENINENLEDNNTYTGLNLDIPKTLIQFSKFIENNGTSLPELKYNSTAIMQLPINKNKNQSKINEKILHRENQELPISNMNSSIKIPSDKEKKYDDISIQLNITAKSLPVVTKLNQTYSQEETLQNETDMKSSAKNLSETSEFYTSSSTGIADKAPSNTDSLEDYHASPSKQKLVRVPPNSYYSASEKDSKNLARKGKVRQVVDSSKKISKRYMNDEEWKPIIDHHRTPHDSISETSVDDRNTFSSEEVYYADSNPPNSPDYDDSPKPEKIVPFSSVFFTKGADLGRTNKMYQIAHINFSKSTGLNNQKISQYRAPKMKFSLHKKKYSNSYTGPTTEKPSNYKPPSSNSVHEVDNNHNLKHPEEHLEHIHNSYNPSSSYFSPEDKKHVEVQEQYNSEEYLKTKKPSTYPSSYVSSYQVDDNDNQKYSEELKEQLSQNYNPSSSYFSPEEKIYSSNTKYSPENYQHSEEETYVSKNYSNSRDNHISKTHNSLPYSHQTFSEQNNNQQDKHKTYPYQKGIDYYNNVPPSSQYYSQEIDYNQNENMNPYRDSNEKSNLNGYKYPSDIQHPNAQKEHIKSYKNTEQILPPDKNQVYDSESYDHSRDKSQVYDSESYECEDNNRDSIKNEEPPSTKFRKNYFQGNLQTKSPVSSLPPNFRGHISTDSNEEGSKSFENINNYNYRNNAERANFKESVPLRTDIQQEPEELSLECNEDDSDETPDKATRTIDSRNPLSHSVKLFQYEYNNPEKHSTSDYKSITQEHKFKEPLSYYYHDSHEYSNKRHPDTIMPHLDYSNESPPGYSKPHTEYLNERHRDPESVSFTRGTEIDSHDNMDKHYSVYGSPPHSSMEKSYDKIEKHHETYKPSAKGVIEDLKSNRPSYESNKPLITNAEMDSNDKVVKYTSNQKSTTYDSIDSWDFFHSDLTKSMPENLLSLFSELSAEMPMPLDQLPFGTSNVPIVKESGNHTDVVITAKKNGTRRNSKLTKAVKPNNSTQDNLKSSQESSKKNPGEYPMLVMNSELSVESVKLDQRDSQAKVFSKRSAQRNLKDLRYQKPIKGKDNYPIQRGSDFGKDPIVGMHTEVQETSESFSEEDHDGFLDMGAYTDKNGSFGWYADFPVGRSHDKVTWSFS